jgi:hypothetical protein
MDEFGSVQVSKNHTETTVRSTVTPMVAAGRKTHGAEGDIRVEKSGQAE